MASPCADLTPPWGSLGFFWGPYGFINIDFGRDFIDTFEKLTFRYFKILLLAEVLAMFGLWGLFGGPLGPFNY